MKNSSKLRIGLDDLKIESFVTSMDSEIAARLMGGLSVDTTDPSDPTHETHTEFTLDFEHVCTGVQCVPPAAGGIF